MESVYLIDDFYKMLHLFIYQFFFASFNNLDWAYFFMGVTTYDFFYKLRNKEIVENESFSKFNLYGFVIHDPIEHKEFNTFLEDNYDYLDQISGGNFLFFTVVKLDDEKLKYFEGRPYFETYRKLENDERVLGSPVTAKNPDSMAYTLAAYLEIDLKHLPVIVVSKDIAFGHKEAIPVNKDNFQDILFKLGNLARFKLKSCHDDDFKEMLVKHNILAEENFGISPATINLTEAMYDATGCFENPLKSQLHIDELTHRLKQEISNLLGSSDTEKLEKNLLKLSAIFASYYQNDSEINQTDLLREWQDRVTKMYLKSYNAIPKSLQIEDFSPHAINLAKSFENEIVLSYFNWIRKINGVPMPDYYDKPFNKEKILFDRFNLNDYQKDPFDLKPLPLGTILICLKDMCRKTNLYPDYHNSQDFGGSEEYLLKRYFEINDIRNKICHPNEVFTKEDLTVLEKKLLEIYNGPFGLKIRDLKNSLCS
jgi:hypothetical protein